MNLGRGDQQLVIDQPIAEQVERPAEHHLQAAPLDGVDVVGEVAALQRPVVDHREVHEAEVGQQEEVADRVDQASRGAFACFSSYI